MQTAVGGSPLPPVAALADRSAPSGTQAAGPGWEPGSHVVPPSPCQADAAADRRLHAGLLLSFCGDGLGSVGSMAEQSKQQSYDSEGERVRRLRLRADGQRPLVVNLKETISLTRKLFELRDSARRAR